jgi:hypothetical protein
MRKTHPCPSGKPDCALAKKGYISRIPIKKWAATCATPVQGSRRKPKEFKMFTALFTRRRRTRRFAWKPEIDLSNPRIRATLSTFSAS